jgi:hypothetical protein
VSRSSLSSVLGVLALSLALGGCAHESGFATRTPSCPAGHELTRTAKLFFGRNVAGGPPVSDEAFGRFVDEELTPRFPDGLTIIDGGGQWRDPSDVLVREASKVVFLVLPKKPDVLERLDAARAAYKIRFRQDSVLLVTQPACVSF